MTDTLHSDTLKLKDRVRPLVSTQARYNLRNLFTFRGHVLSFPK